MIPWLSQIYQKEGFSLITRETDYAIRAMIYLATQDDFTISVSSAELSEAMQIPYRFFRKIVLKLTSAKLVVSRRGKGGGLCMALDPEKITLLEIMQAVDPNGTIMNLCIKDKSYCSRIKFCGLNTALTDVQGVLDKKLGGITLAMLAKPEKRN